MMKGLLLKDLYMAKSNILVTIVSLIVLGFGLSVLIEASALLVLAPPCATTAVFISITSDANSKWSKNVIIPPQADQPLTEIREGDLYFCLEQHLVTVRGQVIPLTVKEFEIFALLILNPKRVFT